MVTVVITTCKRSTETVLRAIKSVLSQTYTNWELFVIDDTPPQFAKEREDTKKMISLLGDSRIKYRQNPENMGACYSRNVGLTMANGEFVGYLDDDDEWFPEKLSEQLKIFNESSSSLALVYCGGVWVYDDTGESKVRDKKYIRGDVFYPLLEDNFIGSASIPLLKTDVLREIGGFDEAMPAAQDMDVWLRISSQYKVDYVNKPLFYYHVHSGESISANVGKKIVAINRLEDKWSQELDSHPDIKYVRRMKMAVLYAQNNQRKLSLQTWRDAVGIKPFFVYKNIRKLLEIYYFLITDK